MWYICLLVRLSLGCIVLLQSTKRTAWVKIISLFLIAIGIGFFYKGLTGSNDETQVAKVFWHETRYFHGMFYVLAAIMLYSGYPKTSSLLILFDILFSIIYRIKTDQ